jgi:outer membrane protein assembly factor BamB
VRFAALALVVVLAGCGGSGGGAPAPPPASVPPTVEAESQAGTLRLSVAVDCCYVEGSATQVRLTGPGGFVAERVYRPEAFVSGQAVFAAALPAGAYGVETGQLVCPGFCGKTLPTSAADRCRGRLDVEAGRELHVLARVVPGGGCRLDIRDEPFASPIPDEIALRRAGVDCGWMSPGNDMDSPEGRRCLEQALADGVAAELVVSGGDRLMYARALEGGGAELAFRRSEGWKLTRCESLLLKADAWPEGVGCGDATRPAPPTGLPWAAATVVAIDLAKGVVANETPVTGAGIRVIGVVDGRPVVADDAGTFGFADGERRQTPAQNISVGNDGEALFVLGADGALHRLDAAGVHELVSRGPDLQPAGPLAVVSGLVVAGDARHALVGLDAATGAERWRATVDRGVYPLAVAGDVMIAGSLTRIDPASGRPLWQHSPGNLYVESIVVAGDRVIVFGSGLEDGDGRIIAFAVADGRPLYDIETPALSGGTPVVAGGLVWRAASRRDAPPELVAIDPASGSTVHTLSLTATDEIAAAGDLVGVPTADGLVVVDAVSATERFRISGGTGYGERFGTPVFVGGVLYVARR